MYGEFFDGIAEGAMNDAPYTRLLNLSTMLVIADGFIGSLLRPMREIEKALEEASESDGDVAVMAARAVGVILDKYRPREQSKQRRPLPHAKLLPKIFALTTKLETFHFSQTSATELNEELLLCLSCSLASDVIRPYLPAVSAQLKFCLAALNGTMRIACKVLNHCTTLLRSGQIVAAGDLDAVRQILHGQLEVLETANADYEWDELLRAVVDFAVAYRVQVSRAVTGEHSRGSALSGPRSKRGGNAALGERADAGPQSHPLLVGQTMARLCARLCDGKTAEPRVQLLLACTATLASVTDLQQLDDDVRGVMVTRLGAVCEASAKGLAHFSNPFTRRDGGGKGRPADTALAVLPNLQWTLPESQWSALLLLSNLAGLEVEVACDYLWAWRDDDEMYRPYPLKRREELTRGYLAGETTVALTSLTKHHHVSFATMTQINERTRSTRRVHFQSVPFAQRLLAQPVASPVPLHLPGYLRDLTSVLQALAYGSDPVAQLARLLSFFIVTSAPPPSLEAVDQALMVLRSLVKAHPPHVVEQVAKSLLQQSPQWAGPMRAAGVDDALAYHARHEARAAAVEGSQPGAKRAKTESGVARTRGSPVSSSIADIIRSADRSPQCTPQVAPMSLPRTEQELRLFLESASYQDVLFFLDTCPVAELERLGAVASVSTQVAEKVWPALASATIRLLQEASLASSRRKLSNSVSREVVTLHVCRPQEEAGPSPPLGGDSSSMAIALKKCPGGHALTKHLSINWRCNVCGEASDLASLACRHCNYDVCVDCAHRKEPSQIDVSVTATVGDLLARFASSASSGDGRGGADAGRRQDPLITSTSMLLMEIMKAVEQCRLPCISQPVLFTANAVPFAASTPVSTLSHLGVCAQLHCATLGATCKCGCSPVAGIASAHEQSARVAADPATQRALAIASLLRSLKDSSAAKPSQDLVHTVTEAVEACSTSIFLEGFEGIPSVLRVVLVSLRTLLPLDFRRDMCAFVAFRCRRFAIYHLQEQGLPIGGEVTAEIESNGLATKATVHRDPTRIIDDLYHVFLTYPTLRNKVEFTFDGEEGTGEGPTQEVYSEVSRVFVEAKELWFTREDGSKVAFPTRSAEHSQAFFVLGSCIARSFADGYTMDVDLEPCFWEALLSATASGPAPAAAHDQNEGCAESTSSQSYTCARALYPALNVLEPVLARSYRQLLSMSASDLETADLEDEDGSRLHEANVGAFVERKTLEFFGAAVSNVMSFVSGFRSVLETGPLSLLQPQEMNAVVCGESASGDGPLFTEAELRGCLIEAHGYAAGSKEVEQFISIVANELSRDQQIFFIEFLTGSPRLPLGGLAGLSRKITVVKKDIEGDGEQTLPSCNTCFLYFKLPPYTSRETMKARLITAITEGRKNFSLS